MKSATTWRRAAAASSAPTRRPSTTSGARSPRGRPRASSPTGRRSGPRRSAPAPRQVFGIGLNYREHAAESGFDAPATEPPVFTKFPSCITGPTGDIEMPTGGKVDWEVELVVVIGRRAHRVGQDEAFDYVAGYAVGQDVSERGLQLAATPPQFSMGKSLPGYGPIGPWLVTLDDIAH